MTILRKTLLVVTIATLTAGAHAGTLLIDRGLPTTNLNNAAGSDRSNVSWTYGDATTLTGDSFSNVSAFNYHIDTIRVWSVGDTTAPTLYGGVVGSGTMGLVSSSVLDSLVTYSNGQRYEGGSGTLYDIHQLDFAVDLNLAPGKTFDFFLNGTPDADGYLPFLHASNAALSGSSQQQSDGLMLDGTLGSPTITAVTAWDSDAPGVWDKSSDANVEVYGTVPDAGSTVLLIGLALTGLGLVRRRVAA